MSLDVHLTLSEVPIGLQSPRERIYIRRGGATVEVTRSEWESMYPGRVPVTVLAEEDTREVYSANITHNLNRMASECYLYRPLWRPEEIGITHAAQLIMPLRDGLALLRSDRERLLEFSPENGWGTYELLTEFTANYLAACERWPEAEVSVSR